jgi:hypothetical protein
MVDESFTSRVLCLFQNSNFKSINEYTFDNRIWALLSPVPMSLLEILRAYLIGCTLTIKEVPKP